MKNKFTSTSLFICLFLWTCPAYADGSEEVVFVSAGILIAYLTGFIFLMMSKTDKKRKLYALACLIAGIVVTALFARLPYKPNKEIVNSGMILSTLFSVGFAVWFSKRKTKASE